MPIQFIKEFVNLSEVEVEKPEQREEGWVFPLTFTPEAACPTCGKKSWRKRRFTRLLKHGWTSTLVLFHVEAPGERRFCASCDTTFTCHPAGKQNSTLLTL